MRNTVIPNIKRLGSTLNRTIIIGDNTRDGVHSMDLKVFNDNFILILPERRSTNPITATQWKGVGIKPVVEVSTQEVHSHEV